MLIVLPALIEKTSEPILTERDVFLPCLPLPTSRANNVSLPLQAVAIACELHEGGRAGVDGDAATVEFGVARFDFFVGKLKR